jgi:hypothetical protein
VLGGALLAARCCNVLCQAGGAAAAIAAAWCLRGVCAQCAQCGSGSGWESSCEVTVYVCVCDAYDKWIYNCKLVRGTVWAGHDARALAVSISLYSRARAERHPAYLSRASARAHSYTQWSVHAVPDSRFFLRGSRRPE